MNKFLRFATLFAATSLTSLSMSACADEDDDAVPSLNGVDRGTLGMKILFRGPHQSETLTYEVSRLGEVVLRGDALMSGQSAIGLKIPGIFVGTEYSVSVVATSTSNTLVCRGATEKWDILPGMVTSVEVPVVCGPT